MKASIYDYSDYKQYVRDAITHSSGGGRGKRRLLAESIGCQVSHVTSVLSGEGHFSQEQAEAAARFFGLSFHEVEYFLLLIQHNRAGTKSLRAVYDKILKERRSSNHRLQNLLKIDDHLSEAQQATYYSTWQVSAIHVALSIGALQTRESLAVRLNIPLPTIDRCLDFLTTAGLCEKKGNTYLPRRPILHLDRGSPLIARHHTNWRLRAVTAFDEQAPDALHYSSVFSLSRNDYGRVRMILSEGLAKSLDVVKKSPEEDIVALTMDCYRL